MVLLVLMLIVVGAQLLIVSKQNGSFGLTQREDARIERLSRACSLAMIVLIVVMIATTA